MGKLDLEDAYKYIMVNPDDWELLGSTFNMRLPDGSLRKQYYMDCVLPFGLRSSPRIFCTYVFSASIQRNNMIIITGVFTKVCVRLSVCSESLF